MDYFICLFVIATFSIVSSQPPPKPIGEWSPDRAEMYPNPWVNSSSCKTKAVSGLCDYNEILTIEDRNYFSEEPEIKKTSNDECLCNKICGNSMRIRFTITIMKKIGPEIADYRVAAMEFARWFRENWNLPKCTVILVFSNNDNMGYVEPGADVNILTSCSINVTNRIDHYMYETYFRKNLLAKGINETLQAYRNCSLEPVVVELENTSISSEIIIGVFICVLVLIIGIFVLVVIIKNKKVKSDTRESIELNSKCVAH